MKDTVLAVRLPMSVRKKFAERAKPFGSSSNLMRELIDALLENRIAVKQPSHIKDFYK